MAIVLESASIPRDSSIPGPLLRSRSSLPVSPGGFRLLFPSKPHPSSSSSDSSLPTLRSRAPSSPGVVVCEQKQETLSVAGQVTDKTWKDVVLKSDVPVLVDFWAPWCGPCRMIAPIVDELAKEYIGRIKCVKLNTDESPNTATEYGIRSIPTVMIFVGGQKKDTIIGAVPKSTLVSTIEKFL